MDFELTRRIATLESWLRNGFTVAVLTVRGALSAASLTVAGVAFPVSGTWTPTLDLTTNVAASWAVLCAWKWT
jgi:hypothetical protein